MAKSVSHRCRSTRKPKRSAKPAAIQGGNKDRWQSKFVAYFRVSSLNERAKRDLINQQQAIERFVNATASQIVATFIDTKRPPRSNRAELDTALAEARRLNAGIIIAKLGRLKRSASFLSQVLDGGAEVRVCELPEKANGRAALQNLLMIAQREARVVSRRTKLALARASARGVVLGGNRGSEVLTKASAAGCAVIKAHADARALRLAPTIAQIQLAGQTSLRDIAMALNARGIPTARGCPWSATQVSRMLERLYSARGANGRGVPKPIGRLRP